MLHDDPDAILANLFDKRVGLITYNHYSELLPFTRQALLCEKDQFRTAAARLYQTLHDMDEQEYEFLIAKRFPNNAIGKVLNDRLTRAAARFPDLPHQL